jgi:hypothetical protein
MKDLKKGVSKRRHSAGHPKRKLTASRKLTPSAAAALVLTRGEHPALRALRASLARTTEPHLRDRISAAIAELEVRS